MTLPRPPILVITDRRMAARPLRDVVADAIDGGCRWILLREPDLSTADLVALGGPIATLCVDAGTTLSVSADLDAAVSLAASGIHLPQRLANADMMAQCRERLCDDAMVGASCHSSQEAGTAHALGADYITMSPVYLTESKPGYGPALGPDRLGEMAREYDFPVLGLGGIKPETVPDIRNSGAAGFAVMGDIMRAADPTAAFARLAGAWSG